MVEFLLDLIFDFAFSMLVVTCASAFGGMSIVLGWTRSIGKEILRDLVKEWTSFTVTVYVTLK